ncbi:Transposase and inactivated derivatives [hydrothermal vent metagenome]|uniref:Transposase and inactivated derivatives n=1 Tax=hydrothermal vent metagenome TaxID=652676 RepID=A0A3B0WXW4_9ZZZZ
MARKPRIHVPGGVYHVMLRGNGGQDIFFDEEDRCHFYLLLQEGVSRFDYRIHGFCLMDDHVHLAVQVGEESLSKIMQNISFRYTRWVNQKQNRKGHLFQGRYKAVLVEQDSYLLQLVRYIHLNPVRAEMVLEPEAYAWSGHRAYLGKEILPWLNTEWVLSQFGKRLSSCRKHYEEFVLAGRCERYRDEFHGGEIDKRILGGDGFVKKMIAKSMVQTRKEVVLNDLIRCVCKEYDIDEKQLTSSTRDRYTSEARQVVGWLALKSDNLTLTQVAEYFGRDVTTLSRGVKRVEESILKSKTFAKKLKKLNKAISQA